MKQFSWIVWSVFTLALASYLTYSLHFSQDKSDFIIGEATHGHYQIEMACESCHTSPFGGEEVLHDACVNCHQQELELANDSHPIKKFTDPRNADRLAILNAAQCQTCHLEHQLEQTREMGVTLPDDFCFNCHQEIAEERPSHEGMTFDTCASAGCHNYHDNKALYEDFLVKHAQKPHLLEQTDRAINNRVAQYLSENSHITPLITTDAEHNTQATSNTTNEITEHWAASSHAQVGVNCVDCHAANQQPWQDKPELSMCSTCHDQQWEQFTAGHHGMKLSNQLSTSLAPMTPKMGRLEFHDEALNTELTCSTCHDPHELNLRSASVDSCMSCHNDEHSNNYKNSTHFALLEQEHAGNLPEGQGVSCASCHMPTYEQGGVTRVMHNQNHNLRPNEKMIRSVCMDCHGLSFSIDALADKALIKNNFTGQPSAHIKSIDLAVDRAK